MKKDTEDLRNWRAPWTDASDIHQENFPPFSPSGELNWVYLMCFIVKLLFFFWYEASLSNMEDRPLHAMRQLTQFSCCFVWVCFEIGSHYAAHMGLELLVILLLQSGITDMSHPVWQIFFSFQVLFPSLKLQRTYNVLTLLFFISQN